MAWITLGVALYRNSEYVESLNAFERAHAGGDACFFVAMAKHQLGHKDARKWFDRAVTWMEGQKRDDEQTMRFRAEAEEVLGIKKD